MFKNFNMTDDEVMEIINKYNNFIICHIKIFEHYYSPLPLALNILFLFSL